MLLGDSAGKALLLLVLALCNGCQAFLQPASGAGRCLANHQSCALQQRRHQQQHRVVVPVWVRQWRRHTARRRTALAAKSKAFEVSDETWRAEVLESEKPVLVFFSAVWCGPCRMVSPVVDEVLSEYGNVMRVVEVSTDENPECVAECKVRSVPTLILFDKGKAEVTVVGAIPKNALVHALRKHLKAGV